MTPSWTFSHCQHLFDFINCIRESLCCMMLTLQRGWALASSPKFINPPPPHDNRVLSTLISFRFTTSPYRTLPDGSSIYISYIGLFILFDIHLLHRVERAPPKHVNGSGSLQKHLKASSPVAAGRRTEETLTLRSVGRSQQRG